MTTEAVVSHETTTTPFVISLTLPTKDDPDIGHATILNPLPGAEEIHFLCEQGVKEGMPMSPVTLVDSGGGGRGEKEQQGGTPKGIDEEKTKKDAENHEGENDDEGNEEEKPLISAELAKAMDFQKPKRRIAIIFFLEIATLFTFFWFYMEFTLEYRQADAARQMYAAAKKALVTDATDDLNCVEDVSQYILNSLVPTVMRALLKRGKQVATFQELRRKDIGFIGSVNLMSTLRFRHIRVKSGCASIGGSNMLTGECIPPYSPEVEETAPLYNGKYTFTSPQSTSLTNGVYGQYHAGGYVQMMNVSFFFANYLRPSAAPVTYSEDDLKDIAKSNCSYLWQDDWLNNSVRALFVEMVIINGNLPYALMASPTVLFEFTPFGGVQTTFFMQPFPDIPIKPRDYVIQTLSLVWVFLYAFPIIFTLVTRTPCALCKSHAQRNKLRFQPWYECAACGTGYDRLHETLCPNCGCPVGEWTHTCILLGLIFRLRSWFQCLLVVMIYFQYSILGSIKVKITAYIDMLNNWSSQTVTVDIPPYAEFGPIQDDFTSVFLGSSIVILFTTLCSISVLAQAEMFGRFLRLFDVGFHRLITFTFLFAVVFLGYSMCIMMQLTVVTKGFDSLPNALLTTFHMLLGDFPSELDGDSPKFMIPMFYGFGVFFILIAVNVFIAIISDSYAKSMDTCSYNRLLSSIMMLHPRIEKMISRILTKEYSSPLLTARSQQLARQGSEQNYSPKEK